MSMTSYDIGVLGNMCVLNHWYNFVTCDKILVACQVPLHLKSLMYLVAVAADVWCCAFLSLCGAQCLTKEYLNFLYIMRTIYDSK